MVKKGCDFFLLCREGALVQAVRDLMRGYPDFAVLKFLKRKWTNATDEQLNDVIANAHLGIMAAFRFQSLKGDESLPPGAIPKIPR